MKSKEAYKISQNVYYQSCTFFESRETLTILGASPILIDGTAPVK